MENENLIRELNDKLYICNKILERLTNIGFSLEKEKDILREIESKFIINQNTIALPTTDIFNADLEKNEYASAISSLLTLEKNLEEYDVFYKIVSLNQLLSTYDKENAIDNIKFSELTSKLDDLLCSIKNIKRSKEENNIISIIIDLLYKTAYELMKIEIREFSTNTLYDKICNKNSSVFDKIISDEVSKIDLEKEENKKIKMLIKTINAKGLTANYCDLNLIKLLAISENENRYNTVIENTIEKLIELQKSIDDLKKYQNRVETRIESTRKYKKELKKELKKNLFKFMITLSILSSLGYGTYKLSKASATGTNYKVNEYTYCEMNDEINEKEYEDSIKENKIILEQYGVWEEGKLSKFKRQVTTYDLSSLEELELDEYLMLDLKSLGIVGTKKTETKSTLTLEDKYNDTYRIVRKLIVNLEEKNTYFEMEAYVIFQLILGLLSLLLVFALDAYITSAVYVTDLTLISSYNDIRKCLYKLSKESISEEKKEKVKILKDIKKLLDEEKFLISHSERLSFDLNQLDNYDSKEQELNRLILKIKG